MDVLSEKMTIPQYMFKLTGLGDQKNEAVTGTMLNPLSISGSNQFTTSGEMVREAPLLSTQFGQVLGAKVEDLVTKHGQRQMAGFGKFSKGETRAKWTESSKPQFTVEFVLLANTYLDAEKNLALIQLIKSATLPINKGGILQAPLGYAGGESGTLTFSLGTWLVIPKLVMMNESCNPSVQVMANGYPLYWTCNVTLEPFEIITIDEFKRYFQQPQLLMSPATTSSTNDTSLPGLANTIGKIGSIG